MIQSVVIKEVFVMSSKLTKLKFTEIPNHVSWNKCRFLRRYINLTMRQLATESEVTLSVIQRIEQGMDQTVSHPLKVKVLKGLNKHLRGTSRYIEFNDLFPVQMLGSKVHPRYDGGDSTIQIQGFNPPDQPEDDNDIPPRLELK
jgi:transcriptional regulator with XRE-family HTH domain